MANTQSIEKSLGLPKAVQGKTYAEAARYIEKMFSGREDAPSIRTKKTFYERLKGAQEAERAALKLAQAEKEAQKTKVADAAISSNIGQNQMMFGGEGEVPISYKGPLLNSENNTDWWNFPGVTSPENYTKPEDTVYPTLQNTTKQDNVVSPNTDVTSEDNWWDKSKSYVGDNWINLLGGLGLATSVIAPSIANKNMMDNMSAPENVNSYAINQGILQENLVNRQQIERNLADQSATARHASANTAGGDAGALMNTFTGINSGSATALANVLLQADMADQAEKARVQQGQLGIEQYNSQQKARTDEINAANIAAYNDAMSMYSLAQGQNWGNLGQSLFNYMQATNYTDELAKALKFKSMSPEK